MPTPSMRQYKKAVIHVGPCPRCDSTATSSAGSGKGKKRGKCSDCKATFYLLSASGSTQLVSAAALTQPTTCALCQQVFTTKQSLGYHLQHRVCQRPSSTEIRTNRDVVSKTTHTGAGCTEKTTSQDVVSKTTDTGAGCSHQLDNGQNCGRCMFCRSKKSSSSSSSINTTPSAPFTASTHPSTATTTTTPVFLDFKFQLRQQHVALHRYQHFTWSQKHILAIIHHVYPTHCAPQDFHLTHLRQLVESGGMNSAGNQKELLTRVKEMTHYVKTILPSDKSLYLFR